MDDPLLLKFGRDVERQKTLDRLLSVYAKSALAKRRILDEAAVPLNGPRWELQISNSDLAELRELGFDKLFGLRLVS